MRKVVLYTLCSLDGAVDNPGRYFPDTDAAAPGPPAFDPRMIEIESRMISTQDAVVLGRGMYDEWASYWPTSDEQPFADFINGVTKYVVTSTPLTREWSGAEAVRGPVGPFLDDLRQQNGGDIGVHGSIRLAQSLLAEGLVDELQLGMGPVIDPVGRRLFENATDLKRLELLDVTATSSGTAWLSYRIPR